MSEAPAPFWGTILKSNSNGTYFGISIQNVNRDDRGYVDFEKMVGLDGIALINIVSNPEDATISGKKKLQSRITHNDGMCAYFHYLPFVIQPKYIIRKYLVTSCASFN
jgi:hypothetical protein